MTPRRRPPTTDAPGQRPDADWIRHRERLLDEALEETFPASDPPSIALPGNQSARKGRDDV